MFFINYKIKNWFNWYKLERKGYKQEARFLKILPKYEL